MIDSPCGSVQNDMIVIRTEPWAPSQALNQRSEAGKGSVLKRTRVFTARLALSLLLGVSLAPPAAAASMNVSVGNDFYSPGDIRIQAGDRVTWANGGAGFHTVTADNGSFDSGSMGVGGSFTHTFSTPGVYFYYCRVIGFAMSGVVEVQAGSTVPTPTPSGGGGGGGSGGGTGSGSGGGGGSTSGDDPATLADTGAGHTILFAWVGFTSLMVAGGALFRLRRLRP
jgi:LPXTG-motif cell wall-anchored protein